MSRRADSSLRRVRPNLKRNIHDDMESPPCSCDNPVIVNAGLMMCLIEAVRRLAARNKRHMRRLLLFGFFFTLARLVLGGLLAGLALIYPESHMLALGDLPTLVGYMLMSLLGLSGEITNAFDARFLFTALVVWFLLGLAVAAITQRLSTRQ